MEAIIVVRCFLSLKCHLLTLDGQKTKKMAGGLPNTSTHGAHSFSSTSSFLLKKQIWKVKGSSGIDRDAVLGEGRNYPTSPGYTEAHLGFHQCMQYYSSCQT